MIWNLKQSQWHVLLNFLIKKHRVQVQHQVLHYKAGAVSIQTTCYMRIQLNFTINRTEILDLQLQLTIPFNIFNQEFQKGNLLDFMLCVTLEQLVVINPVPKYIHSIPLNSGWLQGMLCAIQLIIRSCVYLMYCNNNSQFLGITILELVSVIYSAFSVKDIVIQLI